MAALANAATFLARRFFAHEQNRSHNPLDAVVCKEPLIVIGAIADGYGSCAPMGA